MAQPIAPRNVPSYYPRANINNGTVPIYSQKLNDAQRQLIQAAAQNNANPADYFSNANIPGLLQQLDEQQPNGQAQQQDMAKFLQTLAVMNVGRGVNKQQLTPAQQNGVHVGQAQLFGVQAKQPIPYAKLISDKQNLKTMLNGFQENMESASDIPRDTQSLIAQIVRRSNMIGEAFDVKKKNSIYSDPSRDKNVNLYNINVRNERRDNLFSIV